MTLALLIAVLLPGIEGEADCQVWRSAAFRDVRWVATRSFSLPDLEGALVGALPCAGYVFEML